VIREIEDERVLTCSHLPACPGCPRFGATEPAPDACAELRAFCERQGARLEQRSGERYRFRQRARLAVRGRVGSPKIGIFAEGSHRVVDIPRCEIHHPLINEVSAALKASMRQLGVSAYSDAAHMGLVRALQVTVERSSEAAQVVLVCNAESSASALPLLRSLGERLGARLHSLWWNGNAERTNRILGSAFERVSGSEYVVESIGGARIFFPPAAFGQNNLGLFDRMVEEIHAAIEPGCHLVELYAGCGSIGLGLVERSRSSVINELGEASLQGLDRGLMELPAATRTRVRIVRGPAEQAASEIRNDSVVIVDPPRKGLGPELLSALGERAPAQVIYVSCGLDSLLRDAAVLLGQGLRLQAATLYDLFPYTRHVETLAFFSRTAAHARGELAAAGPSTTPEISTS
jgi:23S rRNA (uracil1939-C5)-methyltransferase